MNETHPPALRRPTSHMPHHPPGRAVRRPRYRPQTHKTIRSPRWGAMTKLLVAMTGIVTVGALLIHFSSIVGPILMAFVIAYLLQPLAAVIERKSPLSWRLTVSLIYLIFILILIALAIWGGVGLVQQIQSLIHIVQAAITNLPGFINGLSGKIYHFGPFQIDLTHIDWAALTQQILGYVQPLLGRLTTLVGTLAGSAATTLGWTAFIVIVSYFFLAESGGLRSRIIQVEIPGYADDVRRLGRELGHIWNAFLRGQVIVFLTSSAAHCLAFSILGVRFAIGLGLLAGFAGFLPYIGPVIGYVVLGLVTYFQGGNPYTLSPIVFTGVSIGISIVLDQVFGNLIATDIMAESLKVHPAFVLIAAIVAANLFGILGILVAAPLLATLRLIGRYAIRKLLDQDPWRSEEETSNSPPGASLLKRIKYWWDLIRKKIDRHPTGRPSGSGAV